MQRYMIVHCLTGQQYNYSHESMWRQRGDLTRKKEGCASDVPVSTHYYMELSLMTDITWIE